MNLSKQPNSNPDPSLGGRLAQGTPSLPEVYRSIEVPHTLGVWRKMLIFAGPGYMVAVGYMDPGNWATDLAAGARFNYDSALGGSDLECDGHFAASAGS